MRSYGRSQRKQQIQHKHAKLKGHEPEGTRTSKLDKKTWVLQQRKTLRNICFCQKSLQQMHIFRGFGAVKKRLNSLNSVGAEVQGVLLPPQLGDNSFREMKADSDL